LSTISTLLARTPVAYGGDIQRLFMQQQSQVFLMQNQTSCLSGNCKIEAPSRRCLHDTNHTSVARISGSMESSSWINNRLSSFERRPFKQNGKRRADRSPSLWTITVSTFVLCPLLSSPFILQHVRFIKGLLLYQTCHKCGTLVETSLAQNANTRKRGGAASCGKKRTKLFFLKTPLELNATRRLIFDNLRPTK
jgi:hypothetical protein